ncbi:MAG: twin-arginine translocation pathway signal protein [Rhodobacteraceae bacterium CG17_big_fil_post_rev_8_21_14_2_50_63_15]|nr:MAG: twin-arginine translocation pathway signal protein [Rhodobacteraceae bacterium CG17_big_fil_post_rev_8_21_14_2_50_63_15]
MKNQSLQAFALRTLVALFVAAMVLTVSSPTAHATEAAEIDAAVDEGLERLFAEVPEARELAGKSAGVLLFPKITKAGLVVGGAGGKGALRVDGRTSGYFQSHALSVGYQAGVETFGYALFLIGEEDLKTLEANRGSFDLGTAPSLVIADKGFVRELGTRNIQSGIVAIFFSEQGLMAGAGLQATKIKQISPN